MNIEGLLMLFLFEELLLHLQSDHNKNRTKMVYCCSNHIQYIGPIYEQFV